MMALTHAAIAAGTVGLTMGTADPLTLAMAIVGSQLPDIDTSTSTVGAIAFPLASWLEDNWPHRTITHSLLATIFVAIATYPLLYFGFLDFKPWMAIALGHLISCFSDTFTKQGVQLFWPMPVWCVFGSNPRRRLTTGGTGEYWVLAGAIALCVVNWQIATGGGMRPIVSQAIGMTQETIAYINTIAPQRETFASVSGRYSESKEAIAGEFLVIDSSPNSLILFDPDAGATIDTSDLEIQSLRSRRGNAWIRHAISLELIDEPLMIAQSPDLSFIKGAVVDSGGETIELDYLPLKTFQREFGDRYLTGTVEILAYEY
ncbi:MAG: metal-dependent hydrolase [Limnospira sp.]